MKAIVYEEYGSPDVLRFAEFEEPHAGPGQVRIRVRAAAVNPVDHKIRGGWVPFLGPSSFPAVPGIEAAGVVDEVGEGMTGVSVGDDVLGWTETGAYAPYALLNSFAAKPAGLDWETAAALPVASETASEVLDLLGLAEGETLLLHGAAGAVGSLAVQLAVARGVTVVGTASPGNHDHLRALGALPVAYGEGLADQVRAVAPQGVDAVFDAAGSGDLPVLIALRGTTDRIVTIADPQAAEHGVTFHAGGTHPAGTLAEHARLAAEGRLRIRVAESRPLADAVQVHERSEAGHVPGKLILVP
ncbi:NADP-dependent oxidoreductase [Streptomyces sp. NPDC056464]|uniref:NADP-dependent oxidoreductase n=1 Tax=Streptomyces sp. NPDC056464 TaxID=3345828 RepID=UPI0036CB3240